MSRISKLLFFAVVLLLAIYSINYQDPYSISIYVDDVGEHDISGLVEILSDTPTTYSIIPTRLTPQVASQLKNQKVCLHGYSHYPAEFVTDYSDALTKIEAGKRRLQAFSLTPTCFRPPWDIISPEAEVAVHDAGLELIPHSRDPFFNNPFPGATAQVLRAKLLLTKELTITIHSPLDENTLNSLDEILSE